MFSIIPHSLIINIFPLIIDPKGELNISFLSDEDNPLSRYSQMQITLLI